MREHANTDAGAYQNTNAAAHEDPDGETDAHPDPHGYANGYVNPYAQQHADTATAGADADTIPVVRGTRR